MQLPRDMPEHLERDEKEELKRSRNLAHPHLFSLVHPDPGAWTWDSYLAQKINERLKYASAR